MSTEAKYKEHVDKYRKNKDTIVLRNLEQVKMDHIKEYGRLQKLTLRAKANFLRVKYIEKNNVKYWYYKTVLEVITSIWKLELFVRRVLRNRGVKK